MNDLEQIRREYCQRIADGESPGDVNKDLLFHEDGISMFFVIGDNLPDFKPKDKFKWKKKMFTLNGTELPLPEVVEPTEGDKYFYLYGSPAAGYTHQYWAGGASEKNNLINGKVYLHEEQIEAAANAFKGLVK